MSERPVLPEGQKSFRTNEVCKLAHVQPYMLKYWESYFSGLEAETTGTGQRLYNRKQVELILEVAYLLSEENLTLTGARKRIEAMRSGENEPDVRPARRKTGRVVTAPPKAAQNGNIDSDVQKVVDKSPPEDVKTLLTALREIRKNLQSVVGELRK